MAPPDTLNFLLAAILLIENHAAWLIVGGFTPAGYWQLKPDSSRAVFHGDAPKERGVYAYLVDGVISYVGSAQIGIRVRLRRYVLADNKRTSMRVRQAIESELRAGRTVEVFTIVPEPINYRGLPIDPVVGLEEGLIRFVKPEWNLRGLGRTGKTLLPQVGSMPDIDAE
ncbi:GIY-YIG nuclease family protein [Methylobacterium sp. WL30]|uniref:GIY-YIG nuclease family protein n=1 Tax=Methylobacterium sp. WL30 TaxID=2603895 RepID=UPI00165087EA|nr:GIY-YIG nuclease family protein [Methylobacterium sp. WL30]